MEKIYGVYSYSYNDELVQVVIGTEEQARKITHSWNCAVSHTNYYYHEIEVGDVD